MEHARVTQALYKQIEDERERRRADIKVLEKRISNPDPNPNPD